MQEAPLMEDYIDDKGEFDFTTFVSDNEKWMMQVRTKRIENSLFEDYGITEEQWKNTPIKVQSVMAELIRQSERYEETWRELEEWRDSMPI